MMKDISFARKILTELNKKIESINYKDRVNEVIRELEFIRCFKSRGVQGIVGLVKIVRLDLIVVFKISIDFSNCIEHEYRILEDLYSMNSYCPYFCKSIGMIEVPISSEFINDPYKYSLFFDGEETIPRKIMFTEMINKDSFYQFTQKSDKNIIISLILQVLIALEISQREKQFTHYDLHTSNILIQKCEENSVFLYSFENEKYCVPTYGFYPVIIDTGISYSSACNDYMMMTNTDNYDHGFQSSIFDPLNDVHHFLITSLYYLEDKSDGFSSLSNKIKICFRHLPVLRKSGWKELPIDISKAIIRRIREDCKFYKKYSLFCEYPRQCLEILNGLIILPMKKKDSSQSFEVCFSSFMEEYHKILDVNDFSEHDILFVLNTIVKNIVQYRNKYDDKETIYLIKKKIEREISDVIDIEEYNINFDINYEKLYFSALVLSEVLESNYKELISNHQEILKNIYQMTLVKNPIDMFKYIQRNMTPSFRVDEKTIFHLWDVDKKRNYKNSCTDISIIKNINKSNIVNKSSFIYKIFI